MEIGFIGLGSMGAPMAQRAAAGGDTVLAYDLDPQAGGRLASPAIRRAQSVREIAERCDLVLSMVWDDQALRDVIHGPRGVLAAPGFRGCFVDFSTTSVAIARELGACLQSKGASFLDAAVIGGGVPAAREGSSPIVVAGARVMFDTHLNVLRRLGNCEHVGELGLAKATKVINNLLVGVVTLINAEALSMGVSAGLDMARMVDLLGDGVVGSTVLRSYMGRYLRDGRYGDGLIGHRLMAKDLALAAELADEVGAPAHFARLGRQLYLACSRHLGPNAQFPSAFDYFRAPAGVAHPEGTL